MYRTLFLLKVDFFFPSRSWTRIRDLNVESRRAKPVRPWQHWPIHAHQFVRFRARRSKMQIAILVLICCEPTAGGWNRRELCLLLSADKQTYQAQMRGVSTLGGGVGMRKGEFCCPSPPSPVSGAGRPWILSRIASSSHFQSGNKSGVYRPGGAQAGRWSSDGLLKGQITQRGHNSLRYVWSQHNSGGMGGLHSSMSSPPKHPPAPSEPASVAEHRLNLHPSLFPSKRPWGLAVSPSLPTAATGLVHFSILILFCHFEYASCPCNFCNWSSVLII